MYLMIRYCHHLVIKRMSIKAISNSLATTAKGRGLIRQPSDLSVFEVELDVRLLVLESLLQAVDLIDQLPVDGTRPPSA